MLTGLKLLIYGSRIWLFGRDLELDPNHPLGRMMTRRYLAKKRLVRGLWIATGVMMLMYPLAHFIVTLGLFTTFLSFTILDESV